MAPPEPRIPKILIVDDDPFIADMYLLKFKEEGFDAKSASDGIEGLALVDSEKPDIILLDLLMPRMSGIEMLEALKGKRLLREPKVIILTNVGQKDEIDKALGLGAIEYIIKANFTPSEVVAKTKEICGIS